MNDAMDFINHFTKAGAPVRDLSRFQGLMDALGNPQDSLRFIHVAGTNGKGSTVRFCAQALENAGYKTGEFTSPYIVEYADRIRINGKNISYETIERLSEKIKNAAGERWDYSQFEITNAIAFLYFLEEKCDIVVLETGIGGRLDSTNIITTTLVSVITTIDYDHTQVLGNTLAEIASHKAGIIKPGIPAVLASGNPPVAVERVRAEAERQNSAVFIPQADRISVLQSGLDGSEFLYKGEKYTVKMPGRHQIVNALTAIETLVLLNGLGWAVPSAAVKTALAQTSVVARAEILGKAPLVLVDGAHNPSGARSLAALVSTLPQEISVILVTGVLAEKQPREVVLELAAAAERAVCVDSFHPGALPCGELAALFEDCGVAAVQAGSVFEAIEQARFLAGEKGAVIVCGSLYLASEARRFLKPV